MRNIVDLNVSHFSLAITRIAFHLAIAINLVDLLHWRPVAYSPDNWWVSEYVLPLALLTTLSALAGFQIRASLVLNAILLRIVFHYCNDYYHWDRIIENFTFVFMFAPSKQPLSFDYPGLAKKTESFSSIDKWYVLFFYTAFVLMYLDSVIFKFQSEIWLNGAAFWLGTAVPHFSMAPLPQWLEIHWLMRFFTYAALSYETLFPLVILRYFRTPLIAIGVALHLGTCLIFPLPVFGAGLASLLCFFVKWERILPKALLGSSITTATSTASSRVGILIRYLLLFSLILSQALLFNTPSGKTNLLSKIIGTTRHSLFLDWHFSLQRPLMRFTLGQQTLEQVVPSFDEMGYPMLRDRYWKMLGFFVRARADWDSEIIRFLKGWAQMEDIELSKIDIYCRDVRIPSLSLDFEIDNELQKRNWTFA
ncbi:MAG: hypothetical protein KDD53_11305, partial [Bdellovibrionales bacterium]|nr:hypothetical protein [Bdellovibrionales bacterium]